MTAFLAFFVLYLITNLHYSPAEAGARASLLSLYSAPVSILLFTGSGWLSDKMGRRKPFVIGSSAFIAAIMLIPILVPTLPAFYVFFILLAASYGMYMAVDVALFIDVLPDKEAAGRDLGVANVASNIGQMLAPVAAGQVVALTAGYSSLFIMSIIAVAISAVAIIPVKKVK